MSTAHGLYLCTAAQALKHTGMEPCPMSSAEDVELADLKEYKQLELLEKVVENKFGMGWKELTTASEVKRALKICGRGPRVLH